MAFIKEINGTDHLSSEELLQIFNLYDSDGNGYIESGELDSFLKELFKLKENRRQSLSPNDFEVAKAKILGDYDNDHDGKLNLKELAKILPTEENFLLNFRMEYDIHVVDFMKIWYHYDRNKSGYLESSEIKGFLLDLLSEKENKVLPQEIDEYEQSILELFDTNNDGKINLADLSKIIPVEKNFLHELVKSRISNEQFEKIFNHYDHDADGTIQGVEISALVRDLFQERKQEEPSAKDLEIYQDGILQVFDTDDDGKLSKSELKSLLCA